ncbi:hypothetical protein RHMOL_Rhmol10G0192100 [Rhododendron molle]|uniref:Uncharacterized protein n=1 Tax=Rhododendron molle TaxID=49168 RepID=A0ACC0M5I3_RHOML|nr:hypothetical protein RHMOL_Rhmol10G0192100 [Rhododendron molle]
MFPDWQRYAVAELSTTIRESTVSVTTTNESSESVWEISLEGSGPDLSTRHGCSAVDLVHASATAEAESEIFSLMNTYYLETENLNYPFFRIHGTVRYAISSQAVVLIYSWEFCARNHEERIPRRIIIPQIGRLGEAAQKYQAATQNTTSGIPMQELQSNCNTLLLIDKYMYFSRFVTSAHQLAKALEVPLVNDLGYPKRYVRCLQDLTKAMEKRRRRTATSATTAASD